jgi:hypothetical protein
MFIHSEFGSGKNGPYAFSVLVGTNYILNPVFYPDCCFGLWQKFFFMAVVLNYLLICAVLHW